MDKTIFLSTYAMKVPLICVSRSRLSILYRLNVYIRLTQNWYEFVTFTVFLSRYEAISLPSLVEIGLVVAK